MVMISRVGLFLYTSYNIWWQFYEIYYIYINLSFILSTVYWMEVVRFAHQYSLKVSLFVVDEDMITSSTATTILFFRILPRTGTATATTVV